MKIAYTMAPGQGDMDLLLYDVAERLAARGARICGCVQSNTGREDCPKCDMDVKVLPDGPVVRISQSLGPQARGCRLDAAALETAVAATLSEIARGADLLIVNKFGKHEAEGRGFRAAIAEALAREMPVIVGLNRTNEPAFQEFVQGFAVPLAPDAEALLDWAEAAIQGEDTPA